MTKEHWNQKIPYGAFGDLYKRYEVQMLEDGAEDCTHAHPAVHYEINGHIFYSMRAKERYLKWVDAHHEQLQGCCDEMRCMEGW